MTPKKHGGVSTACPTCGCRLAGAEMPEPLAWVRQLARQVRREAPPARLQEASKVLEELLSLPVSRRVRSIETNPKRHSSRLLLKVAFERLATHFPQAPRQALEEIETVQALATLFDASTASGRHFRSAAVITTWTYKVKAYLGIADLPSAARWAEMARDLASSCDVIEPRAWAELDEQEGRVRMYQRRFDEAQRLLAAAARQHMESGDPTTAARALLNLAEAQRHDIPDESLSTLAAAESAIDPYASPYLYLCCQMERALVLCDLGEGLAADLLVSEHREAIREFEHIPSVPLRLAWLQGRVALLLGTHDRAVAQFQNGRRLALKRGDAYDAALVSLDLALVHLDRGDLDALREEAQAVVPILAGEGLHDAAAAALSLYRDALLRQQAGRALIHRLKSYFETARMTPDRRFRPQ